MIIAKEKPFNIAPPNIYIENKANNVVIDVIKVLDKVSLFPLCEKIWLHLPFWHIFITVRLKTFIIA